MLKRMCLEQPRYWDCYLTPVLFAYREAPHESLGGFSPFELLYDCMAEKLEVPCKS